MKKKTDLKKKNSIRSLDIKNDFIVIFLFLLYFLRENKSKSAINYSKIHRLPQANFTKWLLFSAFFHTSQMDGGAWLRKQLTTELINDIIGLIFTSYLFYITGTIADREGVISQYWTIFWSFCLVVFFCLFCLLSFLSLCLSVYLSFCLSVFLPFLSFCHFVFSCPADSSIGDLVTRWVSEWVREGTFEKHNNRVIPETCNPWDIWSGWWKKTMTKTNTKKKSMTKANTIRETLSESDPRDLWHLRHLIRAGRGHDLTRKR